MTRTTALAADALEQGLWQRARDAPGVRGLIHHSDRGSQTCPCATPTGSTPPAPSAQWAARATATTAAESLIGLYKTELIRRRGPLRQPITQPVLAMELPAVLRVGAPPSPQPQRLPRLRAEERPHHGHQVTAPPRVHPGHGVAGLGVGERDPLQRRLQDRPGPRLCHPPSPR